jgi:hypothetical protein
MDALSDVLKSVHLEGAVYVNAEFTAPWCVSAKFGLASVRARLTRADHVVFFHHLTEGSCKVRLDESLDTMDVSAGDLVLFLNEDRHLMGRWPRTAAMTPRRRSTGHSRANSVSRRRPGEGIPGAAQSRPERAGFDTFGQLIRLHVLVVIWTEHISNLKGR